MSAFDIIVIILNTGLIGGITKFLLNLNNKVVAIERDIYYISEKIKELIK